MKNLNDYELSECIFSNDDYSEFLAKDLTTNKTARLVRFSFEVSSIESFRAQFRRDVELLSNVQHFNIVSLQGWGEANGTFFCISDLPEGAEFADRGDLQLSWDQLTDVAWQLASAIQHAHNLGLTHGNLNTHSVFVSPELRVQVGRFGPGTWIGSTAKSTRDDIARRRKDVRQLGQMLDKFLGHCDSQTGQPELGEIRQIVSETVESPMRLTARDIQRRLGELLLRDTDDEIRMIDDRAGQPMARRSLVDELFDNEDATALPASIQPANRPRPSIVIEIVCIVALLVLLIVGIWQAMS